MAKEETHTRLSYEMIQVVPARGYFTVLATEIPGTKLHKLEACPCDFLALCKVTENTYRDGRLLSSRKWDPDIVPVCLVDGEWRPETDSDNFAGCCKVGEDIRRVNFYLSPDKYPLAPEYVLPPFDYKLLTYGGTAMIVQQDGSLKPTPTAISSPD